MIYTWDAQFSELQRRRVLRAWRLSKVPRPELPCYVYLDDRIVTYLLTGLYDEGIITLQVKPKWFRETIGIRKGTLAHETGHFWDLGTFTAEDRRPFLELWGVPERDWFSPTLAWRDRPVEALACAFSTAFGDRPYFTNATSLRNTPEVLELVRQKIAEKMAA